MRNFLRIGDLDKRTLLRLLDQAQSFKAARRARPRRNRFVLGLLFFEASTRTLVGFQSAAVRLGGSAISLSQPKFVPGMARAESLEDTVRVVSAYCDALVLRHSEASAIDHAAAVSQVPIINAGNGADEHPSQAVIDLFAIRDWHRRLEGLRVGLAGDLRGSRAAHSLVRGIALFEPSEVRLMYPQGRELPSWVADESALPFTHHQDSLHLRDLDVLYMAGFPEGRGEEKLPDSIRGRLQLTPESINGLSDSALVLCPLPRIDEIDPALDVRPNVRHFAQSADGLYVRLAILRYILEGQRL